MAYSRKEWETGDVITAADMNRLEEGVNSCQSMFVYKGSCLYDNLPTSGNTVNDTYYVTDKECGYTWNGSAWSQSGAYGISISQLSNEIGDVTELVDNLLNDGIDFIDGGFVNQDGYTLSKEGWCYRNVLHLKPDTTYHVCNTTTCFVVFRDASFNFISGHGYGGGYLPVQNGVATFTTSSTTDNIALSVPIDVKENVILKEDTHVVKAINTLKNRIGDMEKSLLFNLLHNVTFKDNVAVNSSGSVLNAEGWSCTDFLEIKENTKYTAYNLNNSLFVTFYNNGNYIGGISYGPNYNAIVQNSCNFVTPSNATHVIISLQTSVKSEASIFQDVGDTTIMKLFESSKAEIDSIKDEVSEVTEKKSYIVSKDGSGDYSSILECVIEAVKYKNSQVFVNAGEYDLISEFKEYYGDTFFDDYTYNQNLLGIMLKNDIHIKFSTKATLYFNYEGNNTDVLRRFSPFNNTLGNGGFVLENLNIVASRCRYIVHDEHNEDNTPYCNKYIRCYMELDNSNNDEWHSPQCIGGGLGADGDILIEDCHFFTHDITPITSDKSKCVVSYHSPNNSGAKSKIVARGNYIEGEYTFRFTHYGNSTLKTNCYVSNNNIGLPIWVGYEVDGATTPQNVNLIEWNNEIRS